MQAVRYRAQLFGTVEYVANAAGFLTGGIMRVSEKGQITIPRRLRERFGLNHNVEVELTPTERGILIHKRAPARHPVERVYAILDSGKDTYDYIEEIRGR